MNQWNRPLGLPLSVVTSNFLSVVPWVEGKTNPEPRKTSAIKMKLKTRIILFALGLTGLTSAVAATPVPVIKELFFTTDQSRENIDSPAVWHGGEGQSWLLATSKAGHSVNVFDAVNGAMLQRVGGLGLELGQFSRPNGIWVVDDIVLVVERDNRRVQVLELPGMRPLTSFGEDELEKPYGLYVNPLGDGLYDVYVTDAYETEDESMPRDADLNKRIKRYRLEREGLTAEGEWEQSFGATSGMGRLFVVESIYGDPVHDHLLIAEELESGEGSQMVKVYDLAGNFSGKVFGQGVFTSQVEGIALYETSETEGYWFVADQSKSRNLFHLFDRASFEHLGTFEGERTLNTDGIWISQKPLQRFRHGVLYACENDRAVSAFCLEEVLTALSLPLKAE